MSIGKTLIVAALSPRDGRTQVAADYKDMPQVLQWLEFEPANQLMNHCSVI
jgi:hypothetical protein